MKNLSNKKRNRLEREIELLIISYITAGPGASNELASSVLRLIEHTLSGERKPDKIKNTDKLFSEIMGSCRPLTGPMVIGVPTSMPPPHAPHPGGSAPIIPFPGGPGGGPRPDPFSPNWN